MPRLNLEERRAFAETKGITQESVKVAGASLPDSLIAPNQKASKTFSLTDISNVLRPKEKTEQGLPSYAVFSRRVDYEAGQVIELPIATLQDNPFNPRHFYTDADIAQMGQQLAADGQIMPTIVCVAEEMGHFIIVDGHRRTRGRQWGKKETVNAIVLPISTTAELYAYAYKLNVQRAPQTVFDNALAWTNLIEKKVVKDQTELIAFLGEDKATVSKTVQLADLPHSILQKMHAETAKFGMSVAYEIVLYYKLRGEEATLRLVEKVILESLGYRDVERIRKSKAALAEAAPSKQRKRYDHMYDLAIAGGRVGQLKTYNDGRIDVNLQGLPEDKRAKFVEGVQKLIAEL